MADTVSGGSQPDKTQRSSSFQKGKIDQCCGCSKVCLGKHFLDAMPITHVLRQMCFRAGATFAKAVGTDVPGCDASSHPPAGKPSM
mmetsp:Transcript_51011/g.153341  ORF Transcript_51011/g.153341 Transcript_51011/m.153341 type:complete len:86 (-) Transcript_51011:1123-1380(-)